MKDVRDELVRLVYKTVFICIAVFIIAAVSYTHLDVYKRQGHGDAVI